MTISTFTRFCIDRSPNLALPGMARTRILSHRMSCATGQARTIRNRSLGEAVERQLSFCRQETGCPNQALEDLRPDIREWFQLLMQTDEDGDNRNKRFKTVPTLDLSTNQVIQAPAVAFTLSEHVDDKLFPYRDSSGTALHSSREKAIDAAVCEFVERQSLTLFWYFGHLNAAVDAASELANLEGEARSILQVLSATGGVTLFDISLFSGYSSILAVYTSKSGSVWFSSGASADQDPRQAANKAIQELYQAFVLMHQLIRGDKAETDDNVTNGYLQLNTSDTAQEFDRLSCSELSQGSFLEANSRGRIDFHSDFILAQETVLRTRRKGSALHHVVLHGINAFPTMTCTPSMDAAQLKAACRYGYSNQIRKGPIPFA